MMVATLVFGAAGWLTAAVAIAVVLGLLVAWGYTRVRASAGVRWLAAGLKMVGIGLLAVCLLEPLWSGSRVRPGANLFVVLADNSRSMTLHDRGEDRTRGEQVKAATTRPSAWLDRVGEDFDLRVHRFDAKLRPAADFSTLAFTGDASNLGAALAGVAKQYSGRPLAGVMLLTDGRATDADAVERLLTGPDAAKLPPIYPVLVGNDAPAADINLLRVDVSQTDFEDAPVTVTARLSTDGYSGKSVAIDLIDDAGKTVEQQTLNVAADTAELTARFKVRPPKPGVTFYRVRVAESGRMADVDSGSGPEATYANNTRQVVVDRGRGPYRVLYVGGRPNWEFKFMQRALESDDQVQLVGLVRIAKREPKFAYLGRAGDSSNPLFRGFDNKDAEQAEQYDQPVLVRLGTRDADELRAGFPRTAEELNGFSAIILDDIEAGFFTSDQLQLLKEFVRQRGGGLLMLGGQESFYEGQYDRTPLGDLLPVYTTATPTATNEDVRYRLSLTREGWLAPWVRLRADEPAERTRIESMPGFATLNAVRGIKPGATVLATADAVSDTGQQTTGVPALVEQRFGRGRAAALLIGDLWRWTLRRPPDAQDDLPKAWRQTVRWLVSDVPKRVEIRLAAAAEPDAAENALAIGVRVSDRAYKPLDNVAVTVKVTAPDNAVIELSAEPSTAEAGLYRATFVPRQPGAYRVAVSAANVDGQEPGRAEAGWVSDPAPDEFTDLRPDRLLLERIAATTGGQMVAANDLESFARTLPDRRAQIMEPEVRPLWHEPWVLALIVVCLAGEWGLRRVKGLP